MYLSHKGTFAAAATIFGLGLFLTFIISDNLGQPLSTGSSAQTAPAPGSALLTPVPSSAANTISCAMCDLDGNGVVDAADIALIQRILATTPGNAKAQAYLAFCSQFANPSTPVASCPAITSAPIPLPTAGGPVPTTGALPTGANGTSPAPTGPGGGTSDLGDCNSAAGPGQKDGVTNLLDFELLRQELSVEVTTKFCDGDGNGSVDIVDFTDYFRKGYNN